MSHFCGLILHHKPYETPLPFPNRGGCTRLCIFCLAVLREQAAAVVVIMLTAALLALTKLHSLVVPAPTTRRPRRDDEPDADPVLPDLKHGHTRTGEHPNHLLIGLDEAPALQRLPPPQSDVAVQPPAHVLSPPCRQSNNDSLR